MRFAQAYFDDLFQYPAVGGRDVPGKFTLRVVSDDDVVFDLAHFYEIAVALGRVGAVRFPEPFIETQPLFEGDRVARFVFGDRYAVDFRREREHIREISGVIHRDRGAFAGIGHEIGDRLAFLFGQIFGVYVRLVGESFLEVDEDRRARPRVVVVAGEVIGIGFHDRLYVDGNGHFGLDIHAVDFERAFNLDVLPARRGGIQRKHGGRVGKRDLVA